MTALLIVAGLAGVLCSAGSLLLLRAIQIQDQVAARIALAQGAAGVVRPGPKPNGGSGVLQLVTSLGAAVARSGLLSDKTVAELQLTLETAGLRGANGLGLFVGSKLLLFTGLPSAAWLALSTLQVSDLIKMVATAIAAVIGLLGPDYTVKSMRASFIKRLDRGLPDALDLMVICSEAGLPLEPTIARGRGRDRACPSRCGRGTAPDCDGASHPVRPPHCAAQHGVADRPREPQAAGNHARPNDAIRNALITSTPYIVGRDADRDADAIRGAGCAAACSADGSDDRVHPSDRVRCGRRASNAQGFTIDASLKVGEGKMRFLLLVLLLPAACASHDPDRLSDKPPGLRVAQAALAGGVPEAALSVARRQLASNRDDLGALLTEGQALTEMGEFSKAEASLRRATRLSPGSAGAQFGLGRVLLLNGRAEEAEAAFTASLAMRPDDPRSLTNLGIARDMQEHHAAAQEAYNAALRVAPDLDAARVNLGLSLALAGDPSQGADVLRPLAASPSAPRRVRHDLATALALSGDHAGAEALLRPDLTAEQMPIALSGLTALRAQ